MLVKLSKSSEVKNLSKDDLIELSPLFLIHKIPLAPICGLLTQSVRLSISFLDNSDFSGKTRHPVYSALSNMLKFLPLTFSVISFICIFYKAPALLVLVVVLCNSWT